MSLTRKPASRQDDTFTDSTPYICTIGSLLLMLPKLDCKMLHRDPRTMSWLQLRPEPVAHEPNIVLDMASDALLATTAPPELAVAQSVNVESEMIRACSSSAGPSTYTAPRVWLTCSLEKVTDCTPSPDAPITCTTGSLLTMLTKLVCAMRTLLPVPDTVMASCPQLRTPFALQAEKVELDTDKADTLAATTAAPPAFDLQFLIVEFKICIH